MCVVMLMAVIMLKSGTFILLHDSTYLLLCQYQFYYYASIILCSYFTTEHLQPNRKFVLLAGDCMESLPKSCSPKPHHSMPYMHKNHSFIGTLRLARIVGKEQNYKSEKARLLHLDTFPDAGNTNWVFNGLSLCSCFGRCWSLHVGF